MFRKYYIVSPLIRYNETSSSSSSSDSGDDIITSNHLDMAEKNTLLYNSPVCASGAIRLQTRRLETVDEVTVSPTVQFRDASSSKGNLNISPEGPSKKINFSLQEKLLKTGDLEVSRKVYEYFNAPITKYWFNLVVYAIFILCFSYVILLKTQPLRIDSPEWFVIIYIFTFANENLRTLVFSTPRGIMARD